MEEVKGERIAGMVSGEIHEETQVAENSFLLTLKSVEMVSDRGSIDFGGGEYREADKKELIPEKRDDEDDYGWYKLSKGTYIITLNEKLELERGFSGVVQPWWRLVVNGAIHQTQHVSGEHKEFKLVLKVGEQGINLKENARISELKLYD